MKKGLLLSCLAIFSSLFFLNGCKKDEGIKDGTYKGEYKEESQWATYTANVEVTVKDGKIEEVVLKESNIHSPATSWPNYTAWTENYQKLLDSYKGLNAKDVASSKKAPVDALSGATLSSDRLYEAVKNALN